MLHLKTDWSTFKNPVFVHSLPLNPRLIMVMSRPHERKQCFKLKTRPPHITYSQILAQLQLSWLIMNVSEKRTSKINNGRASYSLLLLLLYPNLVLLTKKNLHVINNFPFTSLLFISILMANNLLNVISFGIFRNFSIYRERIMQIKLKILLLLQSVLWSNSSKEKNWKWTDVFRRKNQLQVVGLLLESHILCNNIIWLLQVLKAKTWSSNI